MILLTLWDVIGNIVGLVYVFGGVYLTGKLGDRVSPNLGRTCLHIAMGFWVFTWFLFKTRIGAIITPIIAIVALIVTSRKVKERFSKEKEKHIGLIIYSLSVTWVTSFFWQEQTGTWLWIGAGTLLTLALGDGLGGLVGEKYGNHTYQLPWAKEKSLEGSLGVGLGAVCALIIAQVIFGSLCPPRPLPLLVGATTAMIIEFISPRHTDNFFLPLSVALVLSLSHL